MSKCQHCDGQGYTLEYNPDNGKKEKMFCYYCRGTGREQDGQWMENINKQDKTFYTDIFKSLIIVVVFGYVIYKIVSYFI